MDLSMTLVRNTFMLPSEQLSPKNSERQRVCVCVHSSICLCLNNNYSTSKKMLVSAAKQTHFNYYKICK